MWFKSTARLTQLAKVLLFCCFTRFSLRSLVPGQATGGERSRILVQIWENDVEQNLKQNTRVIGGFKMVIFHAQSIFRLDTSNLHLFAATDKGQFSFLQGDLYKTNMLPAKTVADPREAPPPLFSDQTQAPTQAEKIFLDTAPPPPPPLYLKVWIRHWKNIRRVYKQCNVQPGPIERHISTLRLPIYANSQYFRLTVMGGGYQTEIVYQKGALAALTSQRGRLSNKRRLGTDHQKTYGKEGG